MEIDDFMSQFYKKWWHNFKLFKKVQCKNVVHQEKPGKYKL